MCIPILAVVFLLLALSWITRPFFWGRWFWGFGWRRPWLARRPLPPGSFRRRGRWRRW